MNYSRLAMILAFLLLAPVAFAAPIGNGFEYVICVATVDHHELRYDSTWPTEAQARARQTSILIDGWVVSEDGGRQEDTYPKDAIVKVRFVNMQLDGYGEGCPPPVSMADDAARARVDR